MPDNLHADRDSFNGCGRAYAGAEGFGEIDLEAVAVVDARDAHAVDSPQAAEDLQHARLGRPSFVDRRGLRHASQQSSSTFSAPGMGRRRLANVSPGIGADLVTALQEHVDLEIAGPVASILR